MQQPLVTSVFRRSTCFAGCFVQYKCVFRMVSAYSHRRSRLDAFDARTVIAAHFALSQMVQLVAFARIRHPCRQFDAGARKVRNTLESVQVAYSRVRCIRYVSDRATAGRRVVFLQRSIGHGSNVKFVRRSRRVDRCVLRVACARTRFRHDRNQRAV